MSEGELSVQESVITEVATELSFFIDGDEWTENATTIVEYIFSDQANLLTGWSGYITPELTLDGAVTKVSHREIRTTVPRTAPYSINTPETLSISIPATATRSGCDYFAADSFVVQEANEYIAISVEAPLPNGGTATRLDEALLREDPLIKTVTFRLILGQDRYWNTDMLVPAADGRVQLLQDIESTGSEPLGWVLSPSSNLATCLRSLCLMDVRTLQRCRTMSSNRD